MNKETKEIPGAPGGVVSWEVYASKATTCVVKELTYFAAIHSGSRILGIAPERLSAYCPDHNVGTPYSGTALRDVVRELRDRYTLEEIIAELATCGKDGGA